MKYLLFTLCCISGIIFSEEERSDLEKFLSYKISQCYFEIIHYPDESVILYNSGQISAYEDILRQLKLTN